MRYLLICLLSVTSLTAQAQPNFQFSINTGFVASSPNADYIDSKSLFTGIGGTIRFIGNNKRWQYGAGIGLAQTAGQVKEKGFITNVWPGTGSITTGNSEIQYFMPYFFGYYKVPLSKKTYLYAGPTIGGAYSETNGINNEPFFGLGGLDVGVVLYGNRVIDIELAQGWRFLNGTGESTFSGVRNDYSFTQNVFTTTVGIRLKKGGKEL